MKLFHCKLIRIITTLFVLVFLWPDSVSELLAQQRPVEGLVLSSSDNEAMPGVNIIVKGTRIGTTTDATGSFSITVPEQGDTLVFSFIGYQRKEVLIDDEMDLRIVMEPLTIVGEEFVVIGYGGVRRSDLTGSISSVSAEPFENTTASSFDQVLQGRATGLTVTRNTGQPGGGVSVRFVGLIH